MPSSFQRVHVVTGASSPIGLAICRALQADGGLVVAGYGQHDAALKELAAQAPMQPGAGRILPVQCDLGNGAALAPFVTNIIQDWRRIDTFVHCAAQTLRKSALLTTQAECDGLLDINLTAAMQLCRSVLRPMFRQESGAIVLVGSHAGTHGMAGQSLYAASKAALHAYGLSLAGEVGSKNIRVNIVAPGVVDSASAQYGARDQEKIVEAIGLRRFARPDEIASVVAFLASSAASYISGAVIPVDGAARF